MTQRLYATKSPEGWYMTVDHYWLHVGSDTGGEHFRCSRCGERVGALPGQWPPTAGCQPVIITPSNTVVPVTIAAGHGEE